MDLSIVIVSWNVRDRLRECLRSIVDTTTGASLAFEVFVVDNASHDGSAEMAAREFPNVRCIANAENVGFARANNQAIRAVSRQPQAASSSEFVLLLNPDMRVLPGTLEGIVTFMREHRNARVGVAGCRLVNERGEVVPHVRRFPTFVDQFATLTKLGKVFPSLLNRYLVREFDDAREARVDSIRGSFFCIRQKLIEQIGLLDERFFIWFEEVDFCMRVRRAGWQIAYTPSVTCVDYVGQSFKQVRLYPKQRMFSESMLKYFRKYRSFWEFAVLACMRLVVLSAAWVHDFFTARKTSPAGPAAADPLRARSLRAQGDPPSASPARSTSAACAMLTVQLVTWNGAKYIPYLFASLRAQTVQDWDLIVIDNGSTDGTIAAVERALEDLSQFRTKLRKEFQCRFVRNVENRGFAGGHNQAFAMSESDFVQLLNQDIILAPDYLERVLAAMGVMGDAGAAQGELLRWDFRSVVEGTSDGRTDTIDTLGLRVLRNRRVVELGTGEHEDVFRQHTRDCFGPTGLAMTGEREVFGVSGALPMYRRAALEDVAFDGEIFDASFFSYKEDVDLAFRLRSRGWRAYIVPGARAWHDRTAAGPRELSDYAALDQRRTKSTLVRYHSYKNHLFVLMKNERFASFVRDWPWICWYELKKFAYVLCYDHATLRALREVWQQRRSMRRKRAQIMARVRVAPAELRKWYA